MWETWVQSLGQEDLVEKEMAAYSSVLAWRIPRTEEPGGLQSWDYEESDSTEWLTLSLFNVNKGKKTENTWNRASFGIPVDVILGDTRAEQLPI